MVYYRYQSFLSPIEVAMGKIGNLHNFADNIYGQIRSENLQSCRVADEQKIIAMVRLWLENCPKVR
jgi:ribosomal protein L16/L10AE